MSFSPEYYVKVIESLQNLLLEQVKETDELKKELEEVKKQNAELTRELDNKRADNY